MLVEHLPYFEHQEERRDGVQGGDAVGRSCKRTCALPTQLATGDVEAGIEQRNDNLGLRHVEPLGDAFNLREDLDGDLHVHQPGRNPGLLFQVGKA